MGGGAGKSATGAEASANVTAAGASYWSSASSRSFPALDDADDVEGGEVGERGA